MLQGNRTLGPELFDAAVRVDVDEIEGVAGPVLGDVGVGKFVASACCSRLLADSWQARVARRIITSRDQDLTITHNFSHELSPITPPPRHRSDIPAEMALAFILDVEREDVLGQVLPLRRTLDQFIRVLQNMRNAVVEVSHAVQVGVPGRHIVVADFPEGAVEGGEGVFADVGVVAPAAELVAVVEGDC
jgi:hypothetical protein